MSVSQQVFVQVAATILIGTFIAYAVDLRSDQDPEVDMSDYPRIVRLAYEFALWWARLVPLFVTFTLLVLVHAAYFDALSRPTAALVLWVTTASVVGLGVNGFMARTLR